MPKRLFSLIQPHHYTLLLTPNLEEFVFSGKEIVTFALTRASQSLTFHASELSVKRAELIDDGKTYVPVVTYDEDAKTVTFTFDHKLSAGEKVLHVEFSGILGEKAKGWYRSRYEENGESKYMAVTQFEEIGARQAFVCIDEPSAKAVFDVTLTVPKDCIAISNTKEDTITEEKNGLTSYHFSPTPKMSTYLLAFIVGKLESQEQKTREGVLVRAFTTPGKSELTKFSLTVATKVLSFFNEYFAISYPLPLLNVIAIPDFDAGAMENWGAVTFRESILLIDEERSSLVNKQWAALVIAHELAHMWFGNLVTMEWWTHLWLNEGFACYIEYLAINSLYPEWELWKQFAVTEHNSALGLDGLKNTHPIEIPIDDDRNVKEIFDGISYAKGASVIYMLASFLGEAVFRDGLRFYLKKHAYQNAQTEDLWEALSSVSKKDVKEIMQFWTQKPGYPLITVSQEGKDLIISQKHFFATPVSAIKDDTVWNIPLRVTQSSKNSEALLIHEQLTRLPHAKEKSWVKFNSEEAAFVRTIYSPVNYKALHQPILEKALSPIDRMGIIRDAFAASKAGMLATDETLRLLESYKNEDDYIVWSTIIAYLGAIENIIYEIPGALEKFHLFARGIIASIAANVGWTAKKGESHTAVLLRATVLSAFGRFGDTKTIEKAREIFSSYVSGKETIDPNIRSVVFSLVAEYGGEKEFEQLVTLYKKETLEQEKIRLIVALTQFRNVSMLEKTLNFFLLDEVRWQDKSRFIMLVFGNPHGKRLAWNFITTHWLLFEKEYKGLHGFSRLIEGVGEIASKEMLTEVEDFFAAHKVKELARTINQAVERINANIDWLNRDGEKILEFLKSV